MRKRFLFFIIIILLNCYNSGVKLNLNKKSKTKNIPIEEEKTIDNIDYEVKLEDFASLFFDKSIFIKKQSSGSIPSISIQKPMLNSDNFKAIIDWQVKGGRQIKLLNIKTGKEYIIRDWEKTGDNILLERDLFYYKIKIENQIIKVKR
jgi:hypothetical protein